jgi:hypothetical protein
MSRGGLDKESPAFAGLCLEQFDRIAAFRSERFEVLRRNVCEEGNDISRHDLLMSAQGPGCVKTPLML